MGLSFLYPAFLLAGLAVAVPIVLHLLRHRTETVVDFPAVRLLHKAPLEQRRRRRLRELILLALRVAALLLLALAFARPYLAARGLDVAAPVTVVAMDVSMSLSAPGALEAAREVARRAVNEVPATHAVAVITFADAATLVMPPSPDRGAAIAAVDAATAGAGGTRYRTALARAAETIGARGGRVVMVTDLQQVGWDASDEGGLPDGVELDVREVRAPASNLAVMNATRDGNAAMASVHNFGPAEVKTTARLRIDGKELAAAPVTIAPRAASDVRFAVTLPAAGAAEIHVDDETGYSADNVRFLVLDPPAPVPIAIVTADPTGGRSGLYLDRALAAADSRAFAATPVDGRVFSGWTDAQVTAQAAVMLLGTSSIDRAGRDRVQRYLQNGGQVFLTLGPDVDPATLRELVGLDLGVTPEPAVFKGSRGMLVASDARHPVFRPFLGPSGALGDVAVEQYRTLRPHDGQTVLARFSGGATALSEETVGRGRLIVFTSDLDNRWNRFPLNASFVPFALETTRYLTRGREVPQGFVLPDVPGGVTATPGVTELPMAGAIAESGPRPTRRVAVNVDVRESNPERTSAQEFSGNVTRLAEPGEPRALADARAQEDTQRLWQLGLLVMFLALASEGVIGRKAI